MDAENVRIYGLPPYNTAVIHGGPGAAGEMAPVARELAKDGGVLEPLQTGLSVAAQANELGHVLQTHGDGPVALVGHSWGAWLALLTAARFPDVVAKVILVSSGPFREADAATIMPTRLSRLDPSQQRQVHNLMVELAATDDTPKGAPLAAFGALMAKADAVDPLPAAPGDGVACREDIFRSVWPEAHALRKSGELLDVAAKVRCPVVALHGADDPHPFRGVAEPLAALWPDFRLVLLPSCGHTPWLERQARERFFVALRQELAGAAARKHEALHG